MTGYRNFMEFVMPQPEDGNILLKLKNGMEYMMRHHLKMQVFNEELFIRNRQIHFTIMNFVRMRHTHIVRIVFS